MADFTAPSFSLGIDFGSDDPLEPPERTELDPRRPTSDPFGGDVRIDEEYVDEGFELRHVEAEIPKEAPVFKRLRRGLPASRGGEGGVGSSERRDLDDDIEEFSSQEECRVQGEIPSQQYHSVCGSSKLSLHGRRVLTTQSTSNPNASKNSFSSIASCSKKYEVSGNKKVLPKLTISPPRKMQFLESDSDDSSPCPRPEDRPCQSLRCHSPSQMPTYGKDKEKLSNNASSESFWNDFNSKSTVNFSTPALDEFCKEYFSSGNDSNYGQTKQVLSNRTSLGVPSGSHIGRGSFDCEESGEKSGDLRSQWNLSDPQPPAYRYFFHDNTQIQKLIRERLHNFLPLGATFHHQNWKAEQDAFDYMGQFGTQKPRFDPSVTGENEKRQRRKPTNRKRSQGAVVNNYPSPTEDWINPRSSMAYPKDAGKRRVHVESHSFGHWFTQGGRKVYISKDGQEFSGQAAYRCYKKETGGGLRKPRKKVASKKKAKS